MRRLSLHLLFVPAGAILAAYAGVRGLLADPFTECALLLAALVVTSWGSWWSSVSLARRYRVACCAVSVIVAFWTSVPMANTLALSALRADIPLVLHALELRGSGEGLSSLKVPSARYLQKGSVSGGQSEDDIRVSFGLPSRTVVQYVSAPRDRATGSRRECTIEIETGWYWRGRCE